MSACFEIFGTVTSGTLAYVGNTINLLPGQTAATCYNAPHSGYVNPQTGLPMPVVSHLWVPDPSTDWFQGVSVDDVVEVSWMVVSVWAAAWALKVLRRAL